MRVFVTGATGFVGSAVVRELIDAGHQVVGLARSEGAAASLKAVGAEAHRGDLNDLDGLRSGAAASDGVIHTAFIHDFSDFPSAVQTDRRAVETLGEALVGSGRPFIISSGAALTPGRLVTEDNVAEPESFAAHRGATEDVALSFAERGVRAMVVRLPPTVHGEGDHGFVPAIIASARETGVSVYPGDGSNRWAAVHRLDAARLYRLALEGAPAGTRLHGVAEEGVPVREIAEVIGRHLELPVTAVSAEEVAERLGLIGVVFSLDVPASSEKTRKLLDWEPVGPGLIADLDEGHYFNG